MCTRIEIYFIAIVSTHVQPLTCICVSLHTGRTVTLIHGQLIISFYGLLVADPVKHAQASAEAVGVLVDFYKVK